MCLYSIRIYTVRTKLFSSRFFSFNNVDEVRKSLKSIIEPITENTLSSLGCIKNVHVRNDYSVDILLDLFVPGYPYVDLIKKNCIKSLNNLSWIKSININVVTASIKKSQPAVTTGSLDKVKHVIAVSSCKGGVGKSTIAMNIAATLARSGLLVGLLDADVYGPSLPSMIKPLDLTVRKSKNNPAFIYPLETDNNLKIMSFGFVNSKAGIPGAGGKDAALMRGPVVSKVINQLIGATEWGELDYLIVDMPPGTGDIQITLCQTIAFSGAVIVTTPHKLSLIDASKGVTMFYDLHVPILCVVENMSYFDCEHGKRYFPFGVGGKDTILSNLDKKFQQFESIPYHSFPISDVLSQQPNVLGNSTNSSINNVYNDVTNKFNNLSTGLISQLLKIELLGYITPSISYSETRGIMVRYFTPSNAIEYTISPHQLRVRDPITGDVREENSEKYKDIYPVKFEYKGNYGVAIHWSDGFYGDIYSYVTLKKIFEEI